MQQWDGLFIDGRWVTSDGEWTEVVNPATENVIGRAPVASTGQADDALAAARRAHDEGSWPDLAPSERGKRLHALADALEARSDDLVRTIVAECGWPVARARAVHVEAVLEHLRFFAEAGSRVQSAGLRPAVRVAPSGGTVVVGGAKLRDPVGVCVAIVPYNAPFLASIAKAGPALAMGNSVVLKPSPFSPLQTFLLAEAIEEVGFPPGVFNLVTGGPDVGELLTTDPRVDLVSFTGSEATGSLVGQQAARTVKRVILELGGKSVLVVRADAELEQAVMTGAGSMLVQSGQGCSLTTRHLVHRSLHDEYVAGVIEVLRQARIGDPSDPDVVMGPLIRASQRDRVEAFVDGAIADGTTLAYGGRRPPNLPRGYFFEPTLLIDVREEAPIAQEEVFGPVSVVMPFDTDEQAVRIANASRYGLGGQIISRDSGAAFDMARQIRSGQVHINGGAGILYAEAPFGGVKRSGLGREYGEEGLLEYSQLKVVTFNAG